jgi:flagellar basal-body rod protein FlgB
MKLFDSTKISLLHKALSAYALRQKVSSENIANINTVGFRAQAVSFKEEMESASQQEQVQLAVTDAKHIGPSGGNAAGSETRIVDAASAGIIPNDPYASGANNVDIDHEMADLAETQIKFQYAARMLTDTFKQIQISIRGSS